VFSVSPVFMSAWTLLSVAAQLMDAYELGWSLLLFPARFTSLPVSVDELSRPAARRTNAGFNNIHGQQVIRYYILLTGFIKRYEILSVSSYLTNIEESED
jgi:hypothetical protein